MKNILVTGGAGFIGSHVVRDLLQSDPASRLTILDNLTDHKLAIATLHDIFSMYPQRVTFKCGDITNRNTVLDIFDKGRFDTVLHFAAVGSNLRALQDPQHAYKTNVEGTQIVYSAAQRYTVDTFYHQSTCEVYGNYIPGQEPFTPTSPLHANSPYNKSKAQADLFIMNEWYTNTNRVIIGRPCNIYGPRQHTDSAISSFARNAISNKSLRITGTGDQRREWLHVSDLCNAISMILEHGQSHTIFNIGSGEEKSIRQIAQDIVQETHSTSPIEYTEPRKQDDNRYLLNSSALRCLGWVPIVSFNDGLRDTIRWYEENYKNYVESEGDEHTHTPGWRK